MIRFFDFLAALLGLVLLSPLLIVFMLLVFLQDGKSPFYLAPRVAKGGGTFTMFKLRSMVVNADKKGADSTKADDMRITKVGHLIRKLKLDELTQLINVLKGEMSLVGPRPQVRRDADLYTTEERKMLTVLPGITDIASIVFSDEGEILRGQDDPDLAYNQLIRPWKSRLALFYIENQSLGLNFRLILLTVRTIAFGRSSTLSKVQELLVSLGASEEMVNVAGRKVELVPCPPPGASEIVTAR